MESVIEKDAAKDVVNGYLSDVSLSDIDLDFKNTRTKQDPKSIDTLMSNIKQNGLINPICLNEKSDGRYTLIAGFTRFEAVKRLGFEKINSRIYKGLSNRDCLDIGISENVARKNLSISEQLILIKRVITEVGEVETETIAARLMLSKQHVNSLLKVSRLPKSALDALDRNEIEIGHGAYICQLVEMISDKSEVEKLIDDTIKKIISEKLTPSQLRKRISNWQVELSTAKFDTKNICSGCEHNSTTFGSLFNFENDEGLCSKPSCFKENSLKYMEEKKRIAEQRFGNLIMYSNVAVDKLERLSANVLGDEQISVCNSCDDQVSIVDDRIGSKSFTNVSTGFCRNKSCFDECASSYKKQFLKNAEQKNNQKNLGENDVSSKLGDVDRKSTEKSQAYNLFSDDVKLGALSPKQTALSQLTLSREMLLKVNENDVTQVLMGYSLMHLAGVTSISDAIKENPLLINGDPRDAIGASYKYLFNYLGGCEENEVVALNSPRKLLLDLAKINPSNEQMLASSWDYSHLETYTMKGIASICKESGFIDFYGRDRFLKIFKLTKKEFLEAIYKADWDGWKAYFPVGHKKATLV